MAAPDSTDHRRGKLAYDALQEALVATGRAGSVYGFDDLPPAQRDAWIAAGVAVVQDVLNGQLAERQAADGAASEGWKL